MSPARVLFTTPNLPSAGGAERQTAALMLELHERGREIMLLTLSEEGELAVELRERGIPVRCAWMRARADLTGWRRAARIARAFAPGLVVSRSVSAQVVGQFLAARLGIPHITIEQGGAGLPLRPHQRALVAWTARSVDRVVAVSKTQVPALIARGFDESRISVIPNAATSGASRPAAAVRAELGVEEDAFVALLVANLRPEKRVTVFVRAVARAAAIDPRIRGLVAGAGTDEPMVEETAAETGGVVRLLGRREDVPSLLAAADVACLSSETEGTPVALIEAMAAEKPIVATDAGGVAEVVIHGVNGLLVPVDDEAAFASALVELAGDPERVRRLGAEGLSVFRARFTLDRMADAYEDLFHEVVFD